jgi:hypothetical protein
MSDPAERPGPELNERRQAVMAEYLRYDRDDFTSCALTMGETLPAEHEPATFYSKGAVYLVESESSPTGMVFQYVYVKSQEFPLSSRGFRRRLMASELPDKVTEAQVEFKAAWEDEDVQEVLLDGIAKIVNAYDAPIAFVAFGKAERDNREVMIMHHHPSIPCAGALELLQRVADDTVGDMKSLD